MRYTRENLEIVLEKINPDAYSALKKARISLPEMVDKMFIQGFAISLKQDKLHSKLSRADIDILLKAYDDLYVTLGYFNFEEE